MQNRDFQVVLDFWFGDHDYSQGVPGERLRLWFAKNEEVDADINARFLPLLVEVAGGGQAEWLGRPERWLAQIILLDQFSRNIFRGTPGAFANDPLALSLSLEGMARGDDRRLGIAQRVFIYLPLEHSEDIAIQERSVAEYKALADTAPPELVESCNGFLDYAEQHREVIARFGRFPHRNAILGREDTPEEVTYLAKPGAGF